MSATIAIEQATTICEQLRFAPLVLAERQLQVLQLRQIYQKQSGQISQLQQFIQLMIWLDIMRLK